MILSIIFVVAASIFVIINIAVNNVVNTFIESVDEETINDLKNEVESTNTPALEENNVENDQEADEPDTELTNENLEKNEQNTNKEEKNTSVKNIEYSDKIDAVKLVTSKFSAGEIAAYKERYNNEGPSAALINEVKSKLKARCSVDEINKIRETQGKV